MIHFNHKRGDFINLPENIQEKVNSLLQKDFKIADIIKRSKTISEGYRSNDGTGKEKFVKTKNDALAYAISRMPATFGAIHSAVSHGAELLPEKPRTLLDVGSGTGAGAIAINSVFKIEKTTCLEKEQEMSKIGKFLTEDINADWSAFDLIKDKINVRADIVSICYVLNELPKIERLKALDKLYSATEDLFLIVEPGTPESYVQMMEYRSFLIEQGANIIAPCCHSNSCLLKDDWCAFVTRVNRSKEHMLSKGGSQNFEDEKFCYLFVSKKQKPLAVGERILRRPIYKPKQILLEVCTENGTNKKVITKSCDNYKQVKKLDCGDLIK